MTQWNDSSRPRPPENPRRVIGGFKFRRKQGTAQLPWTTAPFFAAIAAATDPDTLIEGGSYAVSGQTVSFPCTAGRVDASVQGRASRPYAVSMTFVQWTPEEWDRVVQALAAEAVFSARFLVGEMPPTVESVIAALTLKEKIVPCRPGIKASSDPVLKCSCGLAQPCKHVAAVSHLFAERLEAEPLLLFLIRGMGVERLLERIQELRTLATRGENHAHPLPSAATDHSLEAPLESLLGEFWRPGQRLHLLESRPMQAHAPHAILRRLGASPLGGRFPLVGLLATIYDTMRIRGIALRDRERTAITGDSAEK
ncbi:MAG: hypothetical protein EXS03_02665 [Phycisphaerales bacterium]|nr:hypothetical protein [Phycisphaerales bacterium]